MKLSVEGIHVRRGPNLVLRGLDVTVSSGEIVGVVGGNGAGKSTLLSAVAGLVSLQRGAVRLDGRRVEGSSPQSMVRKGVCLVPQGRRVFPRLSVRRNLELGGFVRRSTSDVGPRVDAFLDRYPRIAARRDVDAGALSGGEQSLVVLGRALMADPEVLLVDEPLMGLDLCSADAVLAHLRELAALGMALAVVDHDREALASVTTRTVVIEGGRACQIERT